MFAITIVMETDTNNSSFIGAMNLRKIPLGTKGRTSILSVESSASCGASFPVGREKLSDRECFVTSFRQGGYTPLRR